MCGRVDECGGEDVEALGYATACGWAITEETDWLSGGEQMGSVDSNTCPARWRKIGTNPLSTSGMYDYDPGTAGTVLGWCRSKSWSRVRLRTRKPLVRISVGV